MGDKKVIEDEYFSACPYKIKQYEDWLGCSILTSNCDLSKAGSCDLTRGVNAIVDLYVSDKNEPSESFCKVIVKG